YHEHDLGDQRRLHDHVERRRRDGAADLRDCPLVHAPASERSVTNHSYVRRRPSSSATCGFHPRTRADFEGSTAERRCSPARAGACSTRAELLPETSRRRRASSTTSVSTDVPTLNARLSTPPGAGSSAREARKLARAT